MKWRFVYLSQLKSVHFYQFRVQASAHYSNKPPSAIASLYMFMVLEVFGVIHGLSATMVWKRQLGIESVDKLVSMLPFPIKD